jgi:hypothetical protein
LPANPSLPGDSADGYGPGLLSLILKSHGSSNLISMQVWFDHGGENH